MAGKVLVLIDDYGAEAPYSLVSIPVSIPVCEPVVNLSSASDCAKKARFIITVMSPSLTEAHEKSILSAIADSDMRHEGQKVVATGKCLQLVISGNSPQAEQLKKSLFQLSGERRIDVVLQTEADHYHKRRLAIFDMDSTLINAEVIDCLANAAGVGAQVAAITERAMQGELDFDESFRHRLSMLQGLHESVLQEMAQRLPLMDGAEQLISALQSHGYKTAIISGGFTCFAQHVQQKLGIDEIHANELAITDGKITGEVKGVIINGQRKAEILQSLVARENLSLNDVMAVGDGANDLPMLNKAGLGIAFRAKPLVREQADHVVSAMGLDGVLYILGLISSPN